ncbi:hypothetical protein BST50_04405 [Vibrio vulnificus]|uniref:hypothetical protein n=1 Tax=Vibrio vulnificus TaxID=672 RepID=UPI000BA8C502|nr:hypothetical protein [Vibrio vulnificus]PAO30000.1 hypothetical protein BST49_20780 [Vibrio vulnificus]PAO42424.1 hypothetical protein BST50_04405 [Vibrio vulnificus]PAO47213.1 hypothetical protein BST53_06835 [Vibrio vulnificus]PAO50873.1 hypothetical protein BST54_05275 [Vibrio vulnificus]PAO59141.1 hypothetical protein BST57_08130 [Vibrio vulnificus]
MEANLRINDIVELTGVSRRSIYNAIDSGKLPFESHLIAGKKVKLFSFESVLCAFPKLSYAHKTLLRQQQEIERLQFANKQLREAIESMSPDVPFVMKDL